MIRLAPLQAGSLLTTLAVGVLFSCGFNPPGTAPGTNEDFFAALPRYLTEDVGHLIIAVIAVVLAWDALRHNARVEKQKLTFEQVRFAAEENERNELARFRSQELHRFAKPAEDLSRLIARQLMEDPHWAKRALEGARLLPYSDTLFGERSHHFKEEKEELATRFTTLLVKRCKSLIGNGDRHVYLLIDSGTTLFPFFPILGRETARCAQRGEEWLRFFHLATNNLPGFEELMRSGRRVPHDRYSKLAIEDSHLLPGMPMPVFAAVAGPETNDAIKRLRQQAASQQEARESPVIIALLVGNWIRIRGRSPRCPVPMARGPEHRAVKDTIVENADEIFVISPLGKIFVNHSQDEVNRTLALLGGSDDPESTPYDEVKIDDATARRVRLVSTCREEGRLLYQHSLRVEAALASDGVVASSEISEVSFRGKAFEGIPHLLFAYNKLPERWFDELEVEFPHYHTRTRQEFLSLFSVRSPRRSVSGEET